MLEIKVFGSEVINERCAYTHLVLRARKWHILQNGSTIAWYVRVSGLNNNNKNNGYRVRPIQI